MLNYKKPLPSAGDRINLDPNRDEPDSPHRWTNPNRTSARVVQVLDDAGMSLIVYAAWSPTKAWRYRIMTRVEWEMLSWEIGPLKAPPKGAR